MHLVSDAIWFLTGLGIGAVFATLTRRKVTQHRWYTLSGLLTRGMHFTASRLSIYPDHEIFPLAVFAYGIVEIFGVKKALRIVARLKERHDRKTSS